MLQQHMLQHIVGREGTRHRQQLQLIRLRGVVSSTRLVLYNLLQLRLSLPHMLHTLERPPMKVVLVPLHCMLRLVGSRN